MFYKNNTEDQHFRFKNPKVPSTGGELLARLLPIKAVRDPESVKLANPGAWGTLWTIFQGGMWAGDNSCCSCSTAHHNVTQNSPEPTLQTALRQVEVQGAQVSADSGFGGSEMCYVLCHACFSQHRDSVRGLEGDNKEHGFTGVNNSMSSPLREQTWRLARGVWAFQGSIILGGLNKLKSSSNFPVRSKEQLVCYRRGWWFCHVSEKQI